VKDRLREVGLFFTSGLAPSMADNPFFSDEMRVDQVYKQRRSAALAEWRDLAP
jgi:hypothetical protein